MTIGDLEEAIGVLKTLLTALLGTLSGQVGRRGADLRYAVGDLGASASTLLQAGTIGAPLWACFEDAFAAGATVTGFEMVAHCDACGDAIRSRRDRSDERRHSDGARRRGQSSRRDDLHVESGCPRDTWQA